MRLFYALLLTSALCCLCGTMIDILLPLLQRYALNHFIGEEMKFASMEKLREQIEKDKLTAESFYT